MKLMLACALVLLAGAVSSAPGHHDMTPAADMSETTTAVPEKADHEESGMAEAGLEDGDMSDGMEEDEDAADDMEPVEEVVEDDGEGDLDGAEARFVRFRYIRPVYRRFRYYVRPRYYVRRNYFRHYHH